MEVVGVLFAFPAVMYLVSKKIDMALSLVAGTAIVGLFLGVDLFDFLAIVGRGVIAPMTLQLALAVALISGLGHVMKASSDLDRMVDSLIVIVPSAKLLSMLLPSLIGTLNVPGGAIMSAPMVEESGTRIKLEPETKTAVNLFFRHIGYFAYPLYASMIIAAELFAVDKLMIIRYNIPIMVVGTAAAYLTFFRHVKEAQPSKSAPGSLGRAVRNFALGFSPIATALFLVLVLDLRLYLAIAVGVAVALLRGLPEQNRFGGLLHRLRQFFLHWINYKLVFIMAGVMMFQAAISASGVVDTLAITLVDYSIPLPIMVVVLGLATSYVTGVHMAATGILAALLAPLLPAPLLGPYISLLFTTIIAGYVLSPIHLCLVLSNEYFKVSLLPMYRKLAPPLAVMVVAALIQVLAAGGM